MLNLPAQVIVADHRWGSHFRYEGPRLHVGDCVQLRLYLRGDKLTTQLDVCGEVTGVLVTDKVIFYLTTPSPKSMHLKGLA